jgi:hypothetical protein
VWGYGGYENRICNATRRTGLYCANDFDMLVAAGEADRAARSGAGSASGARTAIRREAAPGALRWLEACKHTQRTDAQLSQQLRRFFDEQAWLENPRIMDILHGIKAKPLALRATPPVAAVMSIADTASDIDLPIERPLHTPAIRLSIADTALEAGDADVDAAALFSQVVVDRAQFARHIRHALQDRSQVILREPCETRPLEHGLAELVAYLQLADDTFKAVIDETATHGITWQGIDADGEQYLKQARLLRVIFVSGVRTAAR